MGANQHFVPQFYLRNFACDPEKKSIRLFNVDSAKFYKGSIRGQASRNNFYGDESLEKALQRSEDIFSRYLRGILDGNASLGWVLVKDFFASIALFHMRTEQVRLNTAAYMNAYNDVVEKFTGVMFGPNVDKVRAMELQHKLFSDLSEYRKVISDLSVVVLRNVSGRAFLTSDNPCISHNFYFERLKIPRPMNGLNSTGLFIYLPISGKYAILLYDSYVYNLSLRCVHKDLYYELCNKNDVDALNCLISMYSGKNIYYDNDLLERKIIQYARRVANERRMSCCVCDCSVKDAEYEGGSRYRIIKLPDEAAGSKELLFRMAMRNRVSPIPVSFFGINRNVLINSTNISIYRNRIP